MRMMRRGRHTLLWVCIISAAYLVTRAGVLSRSLVPEEALYLQSGRTLFERGVYVMDWGVFTPHDPPNPFHKPPLTSILLGMSSFAGRDPVEGARLVPFLVGWFACLMPLLATGAAAPSFLILASPFFYAAAGHLQTDPTVGLLGYGLISWGMLREAEDRLPAVACAGLLILWLGKLETAVIATAALACWSLLGNPALRARRALSLARWTGVGIACFVLLAWLLGRTSGLPLADSSGHVIAIIASITSASVAGHGGRPILLRSMWAFQVIHLLAIAGGAAALLMWRRPARVQGQLAGLAIAALLPVTAYLAVGYPGDGLPRYFLIAFPPLLILLGLLLEELPASRRAAVSALLAAAALVMFPRTVAAMRSADSGAREAAAIAGRLTKPGDLVCGPDNVAYYVPGRRWMIESAFAPYPDSFARARGMAKKLRAIVVRRPVPPDGIMRELIESLRRDGATTLEAGSFEVIARR
jgi:hypothetical protein